MSVDEILDKYERNHMFYKNGGLTVTGGEPLVQLPFLIELFKQAKSREIHTCLDTSGILYCKESSELVKQYEELFQYTDFCMLDIKCSNPEIHKELTGQPLQPVLDFAAAISQNRIPLRIRHVLVPGITDSKDLLADLGKLIAGFSTVKELEVLPYHKMGIAKYEALHLEYPLVDVPALSKEDAKEARTLILQNFMKIRQSK